MAGASEPLLTRLEFLLGLATVYDLPCVATFEQPVAKKGRLPERLEPLPGHGERYTKNTFNCCGEQEIREALARFGRHQFAVAGGETDVCVLHRCRSDWRGVPGLSVGGLPLQFRAARGSGTPADGAGGSGAEYGEDAALRVEAIDGGSGERCLPERCPGLRMVEAEDLPVWEPLVRKAARDVGIGVPM